MNKIIVILLLFGFVSCKTQDQISTTKIGNFDLNGSIKTFCLYSFENNKNESDLKYIKFNEILNSDKDLLSHLKDLGIEELNYYRLDKDGNATLEVEYYSDNGQNIMVKSKYDIKGNKIWESTSEFDEIEFRNERNYYNNENKLIKKEEFEHGNLTLRIEYIYNDQNLLVRQNNYDENDSLFFQLLYEYNDKKQLESELDKNGNIRRSFKYEAENLVEVITHKNNGEIWSSKQWRFDSTGNCIKESIFDNWKEDFYSKIYEYDSLQNTVKISVYDSSEVLTGTSTFNYDQRSNLVSKEVLRLKDLNVMDKTLFVYNQYGDLNRRDKKIRYNEEWVSNTIEFSYKYDNKENEILRMNSERQPIEFREIEYY